MIDHDYMRVKNLGHLFEQIRSSEDLLTKRELQKKTGLSWATVSGSITDLLQSGFLIEAESQPSKAGRPAITYDVNPRKNLLVGVDINPESLQAVIIDMRCRVIYSISRMMIDDDLDSIIAATKAVIYDAISQSGIDRETVLGIGFALTGAVDAVNGISLYSHLFKNWKNVHIRQIFEDEFHIPVLIEHDPNCLAIAEMNIGMGKNYNNIVFIRLSLGIGMSIIVNGEIYSGSQGSAGEIGHVCMDRNGPMCLCGRRGCVEAYSSFTGIAERYRENMQANNTRIPGHSINADLSLVHKLAKAALTGDADAIPYFDRAAEILGQCIGNLINIIAPDIVILGGGVVEYASLYMEKLTKTASGICWTYSKTGIALSTLKSNAAAIGAAALFIQKKIWETML